MLQTPAATTFALIAFAANSILCRLALRGGSIDPATFSSIRLTAGALTLAVLVRTARVGRATSGVPSGAGRRPVISAGLLFLYALPFSFAYQTLEAGTGALLLFGAVQITMVAAAIWSGEHPSPSQWAGLMVAFGGLVYLVLPGVRSPPLAGAALMLLAGVAWGFYTLRGRGSPDPLGQTAANFGWAAPMALVVSLATLPRLHVEAAGVLWAVLSGAVASGVGYAVWYRAVRQMSAVTAAVLQLSVPLLAACGGVLLLGEVISTRLVLSAVLVLGGIGLTIAGTRARAAVRPRSGSADIPPRPRESRKLWT